MELCQMFQYLYQNIDIYDNTTMQFVFPNFESLNYAELPHWLPRQQHHTHVSWYSREHAVETDLEEKKLLNKVVIFIFFEHKYFLVAS